MNPGNNLVGSLPSALGNLTGSEHLDLASNELDGNDPARSAI